MHVYWGVHSRVPIVEVNVQGKMGEVEIEEGRGMVMEVEGVVCVDNLGGKQVLILMKTGILVSVVVVMVVFGLSLGTPVLQKCWINLYKRYIVINLNRLELQTQTYTRSLIQHFRVFYLN